MFSLKFKTGPRDKEVVHHVAEVTSTMRKLILQKGRLYLPFISVVAKDFIVVPRSLKCQDLGHIAKYCKCESNICAN